MAVVASVVVVDLAAEAAAAFVEDTGAAAVAVAEVSPLTRSREMPILAVLPLLVLCRRCLTLSKTRVWTGSVP